MPTPEKFSLRWNDFQDNINTVFRDLRDNFAVELWTELGYLKTPWVLVFAEIPIAIIVLAIIGSMIVIKNGLISTNYKP